MKYRKILLAYNGTKEGKRALLECADLERKKGMDHILEHARRELAASVHVEVQRRGLVELLCHASTT